MKKSEEQNDINTTKNKSTLSEQEKKSLKKGGKKSETVERANRGEEPERWGRGKTRGESCDKIIKAKNCLKSVSVTL